MAQSKCCSTHMTNLIQWVWLKRKGWLRWHTFVKLRKPVVENFLWEDLLWEFKNSVQIEKLLLNSVARHLYLETFALHLIKIAELNCFKCCYMYLQVTHQLGLVGFGACMGGMWNGLTVIVWMTFCICIMVIISFFSMLRKV